MTDDDVAVIGAACLLPGAADLAAFDAALRSGYTATGRPGEERIRFTGGVPGTEYVHAAYLDRIDLFDHRFFGISLREAEMMDPHQRLTLQLAYHAIENAGYAPGRLRGSRTAVILSQPGSTYDRLFTEGDPLQLLGTLPAALAARVAYLFDLAGPALTVDTACSSALVALTQAVTAIRSGAVDLALAGGVSVVAVLETRAGSRPLRGVESPTGPCRPFDARADGTVGGEGGGLVLLKSLRAARADGDNVLGVLKGFSVNHNGFQAASMSAPSQPGQAEVITRAWRDAGVAADSIGYVECHGSGTPLGDVIEVAALREAFAGADADGCPIGSVKSNLGHLGGPAGMAGLFKVLCGVRSGRLYPTVHHSTPNPLIEFAGPLRVNTETRPWPENPGTPRRAGLSSFGITGTNVHVVVEQPPAPATATPDDGAELVTVSARSATALDRACARLAEFAASTPHSLREVAHLLNRGRDDHPHRIAGAVADLPALAALLRSAAGREVAAAPERPVVLLLSADARLDDADWRLCRAELPDLRAIDAELAAEAGQPEGAPQRQLLRQYALLRFLEGRGVSGAHLVGSGIGNLVIQLGQHRLSLPDALRRAGTTVATELDRNRLRQVVQGFRRDDVILAELGADGVLSRSMLRLEPGLPAVALLAEPGGTGVLGALGALYAAGARLDWERCYEGAGIRRIEGPGYPFDPVRCWCRPIGADQPATPVAAPVTVPRVRSGSTARHVAEVWRQVLKAPGVTEDSDYFLLGGTSIAGISVLGRLEDEFGIRLSFADLYDHRTVRQLAGRVDELRAEPGPSDDRSIPALGGSGPLPLSFGQEQLWFLDRMYPGSPLYNIPADVRLTGPLAVDELRSALRDLAARHSVLRTTFHDVDGQPHVRIHDTAPEIRLLDLHALPPEQRHREVLRLAHDEGVAPFDLAEGPLLRLTLIALGPADHVLLCTFHHSVFDGWSPRVFFRDLFEFYRARKENRAATLPELPVQYPDFAAWQRSWLSGERLERGLDYWRGALAGIQRPELPLDRPRPAVPDGAGGLVEFTIDGGLAERVRDYSRRHGVTTFVTMLAAVDALLYRWAGIRDVVVGVGTSGRVNPATHEMVGYFNNLPPFRTGVTGELRFDELVRRCTSAVVGALDHEEIPLEQIIAALPRHPDPSRHPLFDVAYTYQNTPPPPSAVDDLAISRYLPSNVAGIAPGTAKFDLTIAVVDQDDGPMAGCVEYATALFEPATAERLAAWLPALLAAAMADPDAGLDDLGLETVRERVEARAARQPDRIAVAGADRDHSYGEVNRWANRLAHRLIELGVRPEEPVPVLAERGVELVVGWLAVLKAGGAYVPIDPALPRPRIEAILTETAARTVLTTGFSLPGVRSLEIGPADGPGIDTDPDTRTDPDQLAYLGYTSGSTGRPHGCEITHRNLAGVLRWYLGETGLTAGERTIQGASPGFDIAALEVWAALCAGAGLRFVPSLVVNPAELVRWLAEHRIDVAFLPTHVAELVLTEPAWPAGLRLRVLSTGGDRLRERPAPDCPFRVLNMYGPTECTIVSTAGDVPPAGERLPDIGRPIAGAALHLLDSNGNPVDEGELGELHIGGAVVGRGYHRLPALTATRFPADPHAARPGTRMYRTGDLGRLRPDGTVEFAGRVDDQVEIRGHRVEPAEVERALITHPGVREVAVVAAVAPTGSVRLTAAVVPAQPPPTEADLIEWAAESLPSYMLPGRIVLTDRLPRTSTGKIDRKGVTW